MIKNRDGEDSIIAAFYPCSWEQNQRIREITWNGTENEGGNMKKERRKVKQQNH